MTQQGALRCMWGVHGWLARWHAACMRAPRCAMQAGDGGDEHCFRLCLLATMRVDHRVRVDDTRGGPWGTTGVKATKGGSSNPSCCCNARLRGLLAAATRPAVQGPVPFPEAEPLGRAAAAPRQVQGGNGTRAWGPWTLPRRLKSYICRTLHTAPFTQAPSASQSGSGADHHVCRAG